ILKNQSDIYRKEGFQLLSGAYTIMAFVSVSALIAFIPFLITKKIGKIIEVTLIIVNLAYLFIAYPFTEAMMLFSLMAMMYGNLGVIFNKNKRDKRHQLRQELSDCNYRTINQAK